ncbi:MAG TPA: L,D-transpeptidase [Solirubrobacterales bacterium]|nr:L,D-transpeptidase [Solirubrobacterales bacterium]
MSRRLVPALVLVALLALPVAAWGAPAPGKGAAKAPGAPAPSGPEAATVKIRVGHLSGGKAQIMSKVPVIGTLSPFVPGQRAEVSFFLNGKRIERKTVKVSKGKGDFGVFRAKIRIEKAGKYAASAKHVATATLGGDSTVRKSWRVSFPSLRQGECGDIVVGFKKAMRKMGYVTNDGRCFGGKTARGILAYRNVNDMTRSARAGKGLVKRVFAGRGDYRVRHPGAGTHVEAPLSKQVLVFAEGDKAVAIYPISSGKSSTPTVTGHFQFIRTEPGYNSHGMYYSWYFYGGYAVHGYESVPDYPASHGCLRTFIADQPEIYERIQYGEHIFVF